MKAFNEFPDLMIPSCLQNDPWIDQSWHNDAAPCVSRLLPDTTDTYLYVWCHIGSADCDHSPIAFYLEMRDEEENSTEILRILRSESAEQELEAFLEKAGVLK